MAKKIIKLTEGELNRIIQKVIKEQTLNPELTKGWQDSEKARAAEIAGRKMSTSNIKNPNLSPSLDNKLKPSNITVPKPAPKAPAKTFGVLKKDANSIGVLSGDLRRGSKGPEVLKYQQALVKLGHSVGENGPDSDFGPTTEWSVSLFQQKNGLPKTGRIDKATGNLLLSKVGTINKVDKLTNPLPGIKAGEKGPAPVAKPVAKTPSASTQKYGYGGGGGWLSKKLRNG